MSLGAKTSCIVNNIMILYLHLGDVRVALWDHLGGTRCRVSHLRRESLNSSLYVLRKTPQAIIRELQRKLEKACFCACAVLTYLIAVFIGAHLIL